MSEIKPVGIKTPDYVNALRPSFVLPKKQPSQDTVSIKTAQERLREKYPTNTDSDDLLIDYVEWVEFQRAEAAELRAALEALQAENERLTKCLIRANTHHEKFERQYYLELNKVEDLQEAAAQAKENESLKNILVGALIENHCCTREEAIESINAFISLSAQKGTE